MKMWTSQYITPTVATFARYWPTLLHHVHKLYWFLMTVCKYVCTYPPLTLVLFHRHQHMNGLSIQLSIQWTNSFEALSIHLHSHGNGHWYIIWNPPFILGPRLTTATSWLFSMGTWWTYFPWDGAPSTLNRHVTFDVAFGRSSLTRLDVSHTRLWLLFVSFSPNPVPWK